LNKSLDQSLLLVSLIIDFLIATNNLTFCFFKRTIDFLFEIFMSIL